MRRFVNSLIAALGCALLFLTSCQKENDFSDNIEFSRPMLFRPDSSYYICTKYVPELAHSIRIQGNAYIHVSDNSFGLICSNYTDTVNWKNEADWAYLYEHMGASYCNLKLGRFELGGQEVVFEDCIQGFTSFSKWTHDIPLAAYEEDPDKTSWLEITMIDSVKNMVEGKFQFHFVFDYEHDDFAAAFARKISYVNGEFRVKAFF